MCERMSYILHSFLFIFIFFSIQHDLVIWKSIVILNSTFRFFKCYYLATSIYIYQSKKLYILSYDYILQQFKFLDDNKKKNFFFETKKNIGIWNIDCCRGKNMGDHSFITATRNDIVLTANCLSYLFLFW